MGNPAPPLRSTGPSVCAVLKHPPLRCHSRVLRCLGEAAIEAYPKECCGLLAGHDPDHLTVFVPLPNDARDPRHRYRIDPVAFARAEHSLRARGLRLRGFAHSHPDAPPVPSSGDLATAWSGCVYLICPVTAAGAADCRAFRIDAGTAHPLRLLAATELESPGHD